jgi:hypothetical protein
MNIRKFNEKHKYLVKGIPESFRFSAGNVLDSMHIAKEENLRVCGSNICRTEVKKAFPS